MSPRKVATLLLLIGGLLLLTNPLWLFPNEGEVRHTYERSEITVTNETLSYHGESLPGYAEENSLVEVACQPPDDEQPRACAFDAYLVNHAPASLPNSYAGIIDPEFVELDDAYFRRVHRLEESNGTETVVHDVERVRPETVLAETALNLTDRSIESDDDHPLEIRIAATGDTKTTVTDLEETDLGQLYRVGNTYYTVVQTDRNVIDRGFTILRYDVPRYLLAAVGLLLATAAFAGLYKGRESAPGTT